MGPHGHTTAPLLPGRRALAHGSPGVSPALTVFLVLPKNLLGYGLLKAMRYFAVGMNVLPSVSIKV